MMLSVGHETTAGQVSSEIPHPFLCTLGFGGSGGSGVCVCVLICMCVCSYMHYVCECRYMHAMVDMWHSENLR